MRRRAVLGMKRDQQPVAVVLRVPVEYVDQGGDRIGRVLVFADLGFVGFRDALGRRDADALGVARRGAGTRNSTRSRSRGVSASESAVSSGATPSSRSIRSKSSARDRLSSP